jgi:hypothetical protein
MEEIENIEKKIKQNFEILSNIDINNSNIPIIKMETKELIQKFQRTLINVNDSNEKNHSEFIHSKMCNLRTYLIQLLKVDQKSLLNRKLRLQGGLVNLNSNEINKQCLNDNINQKLESSKNLLENCVTSAISGINSLSILFD